MKRLLIFLYGLVCYGVFFVTFLYSVGFIGNFGVPKSIDSAREVGFATALWTNLALLGLFAVQHSVMARPAFKRWWTRLVPVTAERSTYVLLSSVALIVLFAYWQPMGGIVWNVESPLGRGLLYGMYAFGFALVLVSTFLINHFDLFGLRQVWLQLRGRPYTAVSFRMPLVYRYVRHPLYVGWFFVFWATPTMTAAHLVLALGTSAYMLLGIRFEERDLVAEHPEYAEYRRRVPMLVPFTNRARTETPLALGR
jgi:protein-S-isoprenylcysteine O-methyltransferase Ste14